MRGRPLRILVAEDCAADRLRLRRCLERPGVSLGLHVVATYADFVAALQESYDCAILDFHLHDCEADQLLQELTERDPHCPAIVISSSGAQDVVIR
ncbi:MAG: response regulator, partial [Gammaproteobacteria bacterium]|nr:response regulator [Gammaproteobacteria bacterium]